MMKLPKLVGKKIKAQGASFNLAQMAVMTIGVIAIIATIFMKILPNFRCTGTDTCAKSTAINNSIIYGEAGILELTSWSETIGLVIAGVIILGLVFLVVRVAGGGSKS